MQLDCRPDWLELEHLFILSSSSYLLNDLLLKYNFFIQLRYTVVTAHSMTNILIIDINVIKIYNAI